MFKDLLVGRTEKQWYRLMFWGSLHLIYHMTQRKSSYKSVQGGNFTQSRLFFSQFTRSVPVAMQGNLQPNAPELFTETRVLQTWV